MGYDSSEGGVITFQVTILLLSTNLICLFIHIFVYKSYFIYLCMYLFIYFNLTFTNLFYTDLDR